MVKYLFNEFANNTSTKAIREYLFNNKIYTPGYSQYLKTGFNKNRYEQFDEIKKYTWTEANICRIIGMLFVVFNRKRTRTEQIMFDSGPFCGGDGGMPFMYTTPCTP